MRKRPPRSLYPQQLRSTSYSSTGVNWLNDSHHFTHLINFPAEALVKASGYFTPDPLLNITTDSPLLTKSSALSFRSAMRWKLENPIKIRCLRDSRVTYFRRKPRPFSLKALKLGKGQRILVVVTGAVFFHPFKLDPGFGVFVIQQ